MNIRTALTAAGALVILGSTLTGCSAIKSAIDVAAPVVQAVADESSWLEVGDCFNEQTDEVVSDVPTVPCTEPHDYEVYANITIDRDTYPGKDELSKLADDGCLAPFATYIGLSLDDSSLDYSFYTPTLNGWIKDDDRGVTCIAFDPAGKTTGTLLASAR
ncbi:MAG: septum formation family protein [Rhodoglobus sp.]